MGFSEDIQKFREKALKDMSDKTNTIVQDLYTKVVELSPSPSHPRPSKYAHGLLVNQYYFSVGAPSSEVGVSTSPNGADSITRIQQITTANPFNGKDNVVFLSSNTEEAYYADKLGWQKGEGTNGWVWAGAAPYLMTTTAVGYIQGKYT